MPSAHAHEQVIAANIDQAAAVFSAAQPAPKWGMLDRYLVSAEAAGIPALILITKLDLAQHDGVTDAELEQALQIYRQVGYTVLLTSSQTRLGLDALRTALDGRSTILLGKSGVGKTSLLNALQPGLGLRVSQVSQATGKGRHTTTHQELFHLESGGTIIDTPGVREFGLWEIDGSDLASYFPEMRPWLGRCRFGMDCRHDSEPGCVIRQAVLDQQIHPMRYQSYQRLRQERR
jgi:ribosome biogenesis GTPase